MAKDIKFDMDARDLLKKGVVQLAKEIRCSADNKGRCDGGKGSGT